MCVWTVETAGIYKPDVFVFYLPRPSRTASPGLYFPGHAEDGGVISTAVRGVSIYGFFLLPPGSGAVCSTTASQIWLLVRCHVKMAD